MLAQQARRAVVTVALPADIVLTDQDRADDQLCAAFATGAGVVADHFTGTTSCNWSLLRRLMAVQRRAAAPERPDPAHHPRPPTRWGLWGS